MKSKFTIVIGLIGFSLMMSCEMKKQLEEMHDSTGKLEKNTQQMGDTTAKMELTTREMNDTTGEMNERTALLYDSTLKMLEKTGAIAIASNEMYDALKQGDTLNLRRQAISSMLGADSSGRKIAEAVKYVMSFEFQVYSGQGQDTGIEKREHLKAEALSEFFKDIKEYAPVDEKIDPLAQASSGYIDNKKATFNAMSAALHKVNRKQEDFVKANPSFKVESFLSMIKNGLLKAKALKAGKLAFSQLTEAEKEVIINEKTAILLLQARHNFIGAIFLSESSKVQRGILSVLKMMTLGWDLRMEDFNQAQLDHFIVYLENIVSTKAFLTQLGQPLVVDFKIKRLLVKANLIKANPKNLKNTDFVKTQNKFETTYKSFIKSL